MSRRNRKWSFQYSFTLSRAARAVVTTQCRDRYGNWQVSLAFLRPKSRRFKCRATFLFFLLLFPSCLERSPAIDTVGSTLLLIKKQKKIISASQLKRAQKSVAGIYGHLASWPAWQAFETEGKGSFRLLARPGPRVSLAPKTPFPFPFPSNACHAGYLRASSWLSREYYREHQLDHRKISHDIILFHSNLLMK